MTESDGSQLFERLGLIAEAIGSIFGPVCEVVVHDLRTPERSVVKIVNGRITGRQVGSTVVEGPIDDISMVTIVEGGPPDRNILAYRARTKDGRQLKSSTTVFFGEDGKPLASLCMNLDLTAFEVLSGLLKSINMDNFCEGYDASGPQEMVDPRESVKDAIDQVLSGIDLPVYLMGKAEKMEAVGLMRARGVFLIKGAVDMAADALGLSRYTVYGYLSEIKNRGLLDRHDSLNPAPDTEQRAGKEPEDEK